MSRPRSSLVPAHVAPSLLLVLVLAPACGDDSPGDGAGGGGGATSTTTTTSGATTTSTGGAADGGGGAGGGDGGAGPGGAGGGGGAPAGLDPFLEACLRVDACEADGGTPRGVEACLAFALETQWAWASTGPALMAQQIMQCKLAADDCATVRACDPDPATFAGICAEQPGNGVCDGDTWILCDFDGSATAAMDCAAAGQVCGSDIWAGCGAEADRCQFGVTEPSCDPEDPTVLVECSAAGFLTRVDCATQNNFVLLNGPEGEEVFTIAGEVCGEDVQRGTLGCIGTGEECPFFEQACEGDVLTTCAGGKVGRRDCSTLDPEGQGCGFVTGGPFAGGAACGLVEPACELGVADETCAGGVITHCGFAGTTTVDCRAAGFAGCDTAARGNRTIAFCTP